MVDTCESVRYQCVVEVHPRVFVVCVQGEPGQNKLNGPSDLDGAIKDFKKKFKDKTKNNWDDRSKFKAVAGKYTLIEMDTDDTEEEAAATAAKVARRIHENISMG